MAAIDLQRSLEHGGRPWGTERAELLDSFDSEMQEWEEQLQDMQRKIEELYNEVQARRGGSDITTDKRRDAGVIDLGPEHHGNGFCDPPGHHSNSSKDSAINAVDHRRNGCNYDTNGYGYPVNRKDSCARSNGVAELGDLLQDYLDLGHGMSRKNNGSHNTNLNQVANMPGYQDEVKRKPTNESIGQDRIVGGFEDAENRKNRMSHTKNGPCKDPNKENTGTKPPLKQRDTPPVPHRSDSAAPDRKPYNSGVLGDRKCGSPSVLRKFGAMLQENEGKTLTDTGVVTNQAPPPDPKCPTPGCQRRGLGAGWAPARAHVQKCQADSIVLTPEMDPCQDQAGGAVTDSARQSQITEPRGPSLVSYGHSKGPQAGPQPLRKTQVAGSPKPRPRAQSGGDRHRDLGVIQGERPRRATLQSGEPRADHKAPGGSSPRTQREGLPGSGLQRDDGLIELLDMLEIEHEYSSSPRATAALTPYRHDTGQVTPPPESSPATSRRIFSRPARPANQRPPSRWASRAPASRISAPSGPMSRPPSPLARPPSPVARTSSPALKQQPRGSYMLHTETVIM